MWLKLSLSPAVRCLAICSGTQPPTLEFWGHTHCLALNLKRKRPHLGIWLVCPRSLYRRSWLKGIIFFQWQAWKVVYHVPCFQHVKRPLGRILFHHHLSVSVVIVKRRAWRCSRHQPRNIISGSRNLDGWVQFYHASPGVTHWSGIGKRKRSALLHFLEHDLFW